MLEFPFRLACCIVSVTEIVVVAEHHAGSDLRKLKFPWKVSFSEIFHLVVTMYGL